MSIVVKRGLPGTTVAGFPRLWSGGSRWNIEALATGLTDKTYVAGNKHALQ